jgi:hypothetical protein
MTIVGVDDQTPSSETAPWILALAWPPGTVFLCCLSQADTYTGLFDRPSSPTTLTWIFLTLFLAWTLLVPVAGCTVSLRRRQVWPALVHVAAFIAGVALAAGAVYALDL